MLSGTVALDPFAGVMIGDDLVLSSTGALLAYAGVMMGDGRHAEQPPAMGAVATAVVCCCCCCSANLVACLGASAC